MVKDGHTSFTRRAPSCPIARAELIALVLWINMSAYIRNALKPLVTTDMVHIFTDSLLNLQRVQRGKGKCKPWEERRVGHILDNKEDSTISLCPGVQNPADLPSRGCCLDDLIERLQFWKEGPEFLKQNKSEWPKQPSTSERALNESSPITDSVEDIQMYHLQLAVDVQEDAQAEKDKKPSVKDNATKSQPITEELLKVTSKVHGI